MVNLTGNTDVASVENVLVNGSTNNPVEFDQTSTLSTTDNGGVARDNVEVCVDLTGSNVADQINLVVVIDQSGSTANDSGTDFTGDGVNETILEAELIAAQELFDAYVGAGYDPSEVTVSLVTYETEGNEETRGVFSLSDRDDYIEALEDIRDEGSDGFTSYEGGLTEAGNALTQAGASPDDTNIVIFLSDGFPVPGGQDIEGAAGDLEDDFNTAISGIGIGENSDLDALNLLDNTPGGAQQVLSGEDLVEIIVEPLTDAEFLRFEIVIEGLDETGAPTSQTVVVNAGDPAITTTQLGFMLNDFPIDPDFLPPQDLEITVSGVFAEDPDNPGSGEQFVTTVHNLPLVICFTPGTLILTPRGVVPIETLDIGDPVVTRDHGVQTVRWIGATTLPASVVAANPSMRPVLIKKDALGQGAPEQDMRVSRQHRILVRDWRAELFYGDSDGVLVPAHALCNDTTIVEERPEAPVTYIHMAFDRHEVVYADGIETESFHPGDRTIAGLSAPQREELLQLFPQLASGTQAFAYGAARRSLRSQEARLLSQLPSV